MDRKIAAVFILKRDGSSLLQHRDNFPWIKHPDKWTIPGGGHEPGESAITCARREVFEETGYMCHTLQPLAELNFDDGDGGKNPITLFWTLFDDTQKVKCNEGQDVVFVERDLVCDLDFLSFLLPYWDEAIKIMKGS